MIETDWISFLGKFVPFIASSHGNLQDRSVASVIVGPPVLISNLLSAQPELVGATNPLKGRVPLRETRLSSS